MINSKSLYATINSYDQNIIAKPFMKWAGGKSQLIPELTSRLPKEIIDTGKIDTYIEPFVGGGAFFFYLKSRFQINNSYLFDINRELIVGYKVLQNNPKELINHLNILEIEYIDKNEEERKNYYYEIRDRYNSQINSFDYINYNAKWIERASHMIFLNRTCFNGLFRQNKNGEFNVPHGRYKNPRICDKENITKVNLALKNTEIICGDFSDSLKYVNNNSLVYFDPPYRPLTKTSSFTSYSKEEFNDNDQVRLSEFYKELDKKGAYLILSNSDPKNEDSKDDFFDNLYKGFTIERVNAKRIINCDPNKRGEIKELIIRNYR
ncbi:MAG TPA: DNA adenine methylase [Methanofastidiosum sp.]|nr:DNA adenine methylase [Methanofastidiosum sp.]HNU62324.1 DNA adenine methylase [Methanofastidiosum sp.]